MLGTLAACALSVAAMAADGGGVVVEDAVPGFAGAAAGLLPGDVIGGWSRAANPPANPEPAEGSIDTPFDLLDVETEQAPRGPLTLMGRRGEVPTRWLIPPDAWRIHVRPGAMPGILESYEEGRRLIDAKRLEEGIGLWERAAAESARERRDWLAGWMLLRAAEVCADQGERRRSGELYARAVAHLDGERLPIEAVLALSSWGEMLSTGGSYQEARDRLERARSLVERHRGRSLALAKVLYSIAYLDLRLEKSAAGEALHQDALALREQLSSDSIATADSLRILAALSISRTDPAKADSYLARALRIREAAPGLAHAVVIVAQAVQLMHRGDYKAALEKMAVALPVIERLAPSSEQLARALFGVAMAAINAGDLATAEAYARRALQAFRRLADDDRRASAVLKLLSEISSDRREYALADAQAREALGILERTGPPALVGNAVHHLGDFALAQGDLPRAEGYFRRALTIDEPLSGLRESLTLANDLRCLGVTLALSGRTHEGEKHAARSVEIVRTLEPDSDNLSISLMALAHIMLLQKRLPIAQKRYEEALAIRTRVAPGTRVEADAHHGLGLVHRQAGRLAQAAGAFESAIHALEQQRQKLGGPEESRGSFSASYSDYYQDAIESLVALGRHADAFHVLERSRARSLLDMFAEREIDFQADLSPELARLQRLNHSRYDTVQAELAQLSPGKDGAEMERLQGQLRELRAESADLLVRLRAASPRWASLHRPEPLDSRSAARALDAGTALVAFAVGEVRTLLFVLRAQEAATQQPALSVFTIPIGKAALRERVESFRRLIAVAGADQRTLRAQAGKLYDLLLRPADAILRTCDRLAISPDGPLHVLPFGALLRKESAATSGAAAWLAEWKPLFVVASATHYAELKKSRSGNPRIGGHLLAFADPSLAAATAAGSADIDRTRALSLNLVPLPAARREVEGITALFGTDALAYVGDDATEARAKAMLTGPAYVHFAVHTVLDRALPLNSGLVLALSPKEGEDNGLLQAWEIFDAVRLDAELVTLSGCETAVGEDMGGEGLMSLARAFHYAGARSVVASLWRVSDDSTADLMVRFYRHVKDGYPKAEALRLAQGELIRSSAKTAHPFRWAAFAVFGDWR